MNQWNDPKVYVSAALIALFAFAYVRDPSDETMKGAVILAFATAYGYWLGTNKGDAQRTDNTGKAFDMAKAALEASPAVVAAVDESAIQDGDSVTIERKAE